MKNTRWNIDDLKKKNLVSNSKGDFVKVSSLVNVGKVDKIEPIGEILIPMGRPDNAEAPCFNAKYHNPDLKEFRLNPLTVDECVPTDLFGMPVPAAIPSPVTQLDTTTGEYILWVRTLTGKARDSAVMALKMATEQMFKNADKECFYISGNVASSKNSKEIGRFKKRNHLGVLEDFSTLVDSKVTKAYRKSTDGQWLQNKVAFKNAVQGLKLPLNIEFTFIRDSLRKFDYHNCVQLVADLMTEYGWIPDDETCYLKPVFGNVYYHRELAGVLIKIIK